MIQTARIEMSRNSLQVLEFAKQEAIKLGSLNIDTEHILLGLAKEPTIGMAFVALDSTPADVRRWVEFNIAHKREDGPMCQGEPRFTERSQRVLELAEKNARQNRSFLVTPNDILDGLYSLREGVAFGIMSDSGITPSVLRDSLYNRAFSTRQYKAWDEVKNL